MRGVRGGVLGFRDESQARGEGCQGSQVSGRKARSLSRIPYHLSPGRGQSTLEYAIVIAIVAAALVGMHTYVRRAMQANLKNLELELNASTAP